VETQPSIPEAQSTVRIDVRDTAELPSGLIEILGEDAAARAEAPDQRLPDREAANTIPAETTARIPPESSDAPSAASRSISANPHGERFLNWLQQSVRTRRLIVNDAKALVHTVDGTAFVVTPKIFQRFLHEFPIVRLESRDAEHREGWMGIQKSFERLGRHRKHSNGLNIWTCEVAGPRKTRSVNGYLLLDGRDIFLDIPPDNPYLRLIGAPPPED
jgi:hypothetical protein